MKLSKCTRMGGVIVLLALVAGISGPERLSAAGAPRISRAVVNCGNGLTRTARFAQTTTFRWGTLKNGQLAGFALYRASGAPHWLEVEDSLKATTCVGVWVMGGDGRNAEYLAANSNHAAPAPGVYRPVLLRVPAQTAATKGAYATVWVEPARQTIRLPHRGFYQLWACAGAAPRHEKCVSNYFPIKGG